MAKILAFSVLFMSFLVVEAQTSTLPMSLPGSHDRSEFMGHFSLPMEIHRWEIYEDTVDAWRHWDIIDNYSFGLDRGQITMINDLESLHPYFRDKVLELIRVCKTKGIELAVVETYRTPTKQSEYKNRGRKFTRAGPGQSKHQYGLAVDVVPIVNGKVQWRSTSVWRKVGAAGERLQMTWGGRWRRLYDPGHFEWTGGLGVHSLAQGIFPAIPKSAKYPCLEEDMKELQRHWKAWQIQQAETVRHNYQKGSDKNPKVVTSRDGAD